jgi:TonB-dependent starch-binding outer membrane protein SusC
MKLLSNTFSKAGLLVVLLAFTCNIAFAQRTVKGKVTDSENGDALIGATVSVVGTPRGATTDIDGNFTVGVPAGATQLRFSYTGFTEQTITLGAANVLDVAMVSGAKLDEVVVIGYGSVRKTDATGAVTSITEKNFNKGTVVSPEQLIQGRAAGVAITSSSGEPGAGINIRIRGTSSVRGGNNPLFVVDGVPLTSEETTPGSDGGGLGRTAARNPLNFLNPNDIASIDILKDASATAIYGSRGANGVVIITTKSGDNGKGLLEYGYTLGISKIAKKYDLLNRDEFVEGWKSLNPGTAVTKIVDEGASTDWQDEVTQTGLSHNHNLAFGGADKTGSYRFSLGYLNQEGIIKNSAINRLSARFNANKKFLDDRLKLGTMVTVSRTQDAGVPITENAGYEGDLWSNALKAKPTYPIYEDDGVTFLQPSNAEPNPVAMLAYTKDNTNSLRALGNINAEIKLLDGLSFKTIVGFDQSTSARKAAWSRLLKAGDGFFGNGRLFLSDVATDSKLWENFLTYNKGFGKVNFNGVAGYSYQVFNRRFNKSQFAKFRVDDVDQMINNYASAEKFAGSNSGESQDGLQSYFGRVNLGIADKYIFTATMRADGSTKFGRDNIYALFPSAAFKWRVIDEGFLPEAFSDLGVRFGWGVTGNQEIPHNLHTERQRYSDWGLDNGANLNGGNLGGVAFDNTNLKWETTSQLNFGIDYGFLNGRLSGSIDLYKKNTTNMLMQVFSAQPAVSPFEWKNLDANIENKGIDIGLNVVAVDKKTFGWSVGGNISFLKNEVTKFSSLVNTAEINGQGLTGAFAQRIAQGQPLFAYYVREFTGYDDNGIATYNDDGKQKFTGASPIPKITAGLNNDFRFGPVDVNVFLNGQFGHYVYNNTANALFTAGSLGNARNVTKDVIGSGEARLNAPDVSDRFLEKGDFVRIQSASVGYSIPLKSKNISNLRVFLNGQNLALFTKYSYDPEANINKSLNGVPSLGIDYNSFPRPRTIAVGANVTF